MKPDFEVLIVGAGFAGLGMAMRLKAAGEKRFTVLERADEVGGTWRDNIYPGCACDIPAALYSFSFAPSHSWTRLYPTQPEIAAYLQNCVAQAGLAPFIRLSTALETAAYDEVDGVWRLGMSGGWRTTARVLILGMGGLSRPARPDLPGAADFAGPAFHSARWDHGVALAGRRVAVIGTGASAVQFVPQIAPLAAQLTLFQRTPPWVLPKRDLPAPAAASGRLGRLYRRAVRLRTYWAHESRAVAFLHPKLMKRAQRLASAFLAQQIPDASLRAKLRPDYTIGCKRVLISNDYYPALTRPNVTLETAPIARITPHGVETTDGTVHEADVLIYATGFNATGMPGPVRVTGRRGERLADRWRDGAAHLGLSVPGFPNLFLLTGPNTGLGHNSIVFMIECQVRYILSALRLLRRTDAPLEVRAGVAESSARALQARMRRTVWASGCRSWYLDAQGRNTTLWPDYSWKYWWRTRHARRRDFVSPE